MKTFKCWDDENEDESDGRAVDGASESDAAETFAREIDMGDADEVAHVVIGVRREDGSGCKVVVHFKREVFETYTIGEASEIEPYDDGEPVGGQ